METEWGTGNIEGYPRLKLRDLVIIRSTRCQAYGVDAMCGPLQTRWRSEGIGILVCALKTRQLERSDIPLLNELRKAFRKG